MTTSPNLGPNLLTNPNFDANTTGWTAVNATLTRTKHSKLGMSWCANLAYSGSGTYMSLDDSPDTVTTPVQGDAYHGSAWIAATQQQVGKSAQVIVREKGGAQPSAETRSATTPITAGGVRLQVDHSVIEADRTALDFYVAILSPSSVGAVQVDSCTLQRVVTPPALPAAPTGLAVGSATSSSLTASWNTVSGATEYRLQRRLTSGATWSDVVTTASLSYVDSGLSASTGYTYRVAAINAAGQGAYSSEVAGTTSAPSGPTYIYFSTGSPWREDVSGMDVDAGSDAYIAKLDAAITNYGSIFLAGTPTWPQSSVSVFVVDGSTPSGQLSLNVASRERWWAGFTGVPIPAAAKGDGGSDQHVAIVDKRTMPWKLYGYWHFEKDYPGYPGYSAGMGDYRGATYFPNDGAGYQVGSTYLDACRSDGASLIGGLILKAEIVQGVIPHALAMVFPYTDGRSWAQGQASGGPTCMASACDNDCSRRGSPFIPLGTVLRMKSNAAWAPTTTAGRAIKLALQTYGARLRDTGGGVAFYAESLVAEGDSWASLLPSGGEVSGIVAGDFEVLKLPTLTSAAPGTCP